MKKFSIFWAFVLVLICCFCFVACDGDEIPTGPAGADGADGKSAYEIWLEQGYTGNQLDFLNWLRGDNGSSGLDGKSAYDIWLAEGHIGTTADFLEWLKGAAGRDGSSGSRGATGAKGDDGEDSPYGAMAVEVTTAREFLDALNPRLKKEVIVLKNDISFEGLKDADGNLDTSFNGVVGLAGINRTIIGCKIDVYKPNTSQFIDSETPQFPPVF